MQFALAPGAGFEVRGLDDLDRYLGAVRAAGFDGVSLSGAQTCGDPAGAAARVAAHGLVCTDLLALTVTRDDEATMAAVETLRPAVEVLDPVGVLAMMWTGVREESLDRLARAADRLGVPVLLEFAPAAMSTVDAASAVVDELGTDRARVLADTFHFFRAGSDMEMLARLPLDRLAVVQFDDALPALGDDYMAEATNRRAWPGEGEFDLDGFTSGLRDRGWDGIVSVEVLSEDLRTLPIEEFALRAYQSTVPYWT